MSELLALILLVPMGMAPIVLGFRRVPQVRDALTIVSLALVSVLAIWLLIEVERNGTIVLQVGDWSPVIGIVLVADLFAALILVTATITILVVQLFAQGQRRTAWGANPEISASMLLVLTGGVSLSILTGDLFTLFVAFELILVSSYVLLTHQGGRAQLRSGMTYVVMNLFASTLFLFGVAFVYRSTGTVNMAALAEAIPNLDSGIQLGIGAWFLVVFGSKAAMFPLFSWLPDSYPTAPTTITAVFAGLLTKIGIYSMIRFHSLMQMDDLGPVILILAGVTMLVGVAGALSQDDVKRILSFHIVSQIGYMLMGLGLFTEVGIAAAIFYMVHHIPVKTVLFLVGGLIEDDQGTSDLDRVGGLAAKRPWLALFFAIPALSLAGIPPFSGFVAKYALIDEAIAIESIFITVAALVAGALTLLSMSKIWLGVFWGTDPDDHESNAVVDERGRGHRPTLMTVTGFAVLATLFVTAMAGPIWDVSRRAAFDLLEPGIYVGQVLG